MLYRMCFECRITICTLSLCSAALKNIFLNFILKSEDFLEGVSILRGGGVSGGSADRGQSFVGTQSFILTTG